MSFDFLTIVRNGQNNGNSIYRLALDSELKEEMARAFTIPASKWQDAALMRTAFKEGYHLADNELFEIRDYLLPEELLNAFRAPKELGKFDAGTQGVSNIKAIAAVSVQGERITAIFKIIGKAKKVAPAKNLMLTCSSKGYAKMSEPGIIVDDRIVALFDEGTLLFKSPGTVKQVLSLKAYMQEANDLEILSFLEARFETDPQKILDKTDNWMRKRFASLMQSNLFEERSALDIYETARNFSTEIPLELSKDRAKLILPEEKQHIKMILKFLNEEYYKGVLTGKDYQTASKRPLQNREQAGGLQMAI